MSIVHAVMEYWIKVSEAGRARRPPVGTLDLAVPIFRS